MKKTWRKRTKYEGARGTIEEVGHGQGLLQGKGEVKHFVIIFQQLSLGAHPMILSNFLLNIQQNRRSPRGIVMIEDGIPGEMTMKMIVIEGHPEVRKTDEIMNIEGETGKSGTTTEGNVTEIETIGIDRIKRKKKRPREKAHQNFLKIERSPKESKVRRVSSWRNLRLQIFLSDFVILFACQVKQQQIRVGGN